MGGTTSYYPNSRGEWRDQPELAEPPVEIHGAAAHWDHRLDDDHYEQPTKPAKSLLTPTDHILVLIDFQSQMAFATKSIGTELLRNNVALVGHAATAFDVSTILTTVAEKTFSGPMFDELHEAFPGEPVIERTSMNSWEDGHEVRLHACRSKSTGLR